MKICTVHGVLDCDDELSRKILAPHKAQVKKIFVEELYSSESTQQRYLFSTLCIGIHFIVLQTIFALLKFSIEIAATR